MCYVKKNFNGPIILENGGIFLFNINLNQTKTGRIVTSSLPHKIALDINFGLNRPSGLLKFVLAKVYCIALVIFYPKFHLNLGELFKKYFVKIEVSVQSMVV